MLLVLIDVYKVGPFHSLLGTPLFRIVLFSYDLGNIPIITEWPPLSLTAQILSFS